MFAKQILIQMLCDNICKIIYHGFCWWQEKFLEQFSEDAYACCVKDRKKSVAYKHLGNYSINNFLLSCFYCFYIKVAWS